eukprot:78365-Alexandrium_andersonii.AAC.1
MLPPASAVGPPVVAPPDMEAIRRMYPHWTADDILQKLAEDKQRMEMQQQSVMHTQMLQAMMSQFSGVANTLQNLEVRTAAQVDE